MRDIKKRYAKIFLEEKESLGDMHLHVCETEIALIFLVF